MFISVNLCHSNNFIYFFLCFGIKILQELPIPAVNCTYLFLYSLTIRDRLVFKPGRGMEELGNVKLFHIGKKRIRGGTRIISIKGGGGEGNEIFVRKYIQVLHPKLQAYKY